MAFSNAAAKRELSIQFWPNSLFFSYFWDIVLYLFQPLNAILHRFVYFKSLFTFTYYLSSMCAFVFILLQVVLVQGHYLSFLPLCSRNEPVFLATCTPIAMPETRECVVQGATNVFTTIHSMDMKIAHIDKKWVVRMCARCVCIYFTYCIILKMFIVDLIFF